VRKLLLLLVLLGIVLAFAMASGFTPFFRLAYLLVGTLVASFLWAWLALRWLDVTVDQRTKEAWVGGWMEERIRVRNTGWMPKPWFQVHDPSDMTGFSAGRVVSLPPAGFRSWLTRAPCERRGFYSFGPLTAVAQDPFGVFHLKRTFGSPRQLIVYPAIVPVPPFLLPLTHLAGESRTHRRVFHTTTSASSLREYLPGDAYKRIHWPSTARFQKVMVKEFDLEPSSDYWVVLDLEQRVQAGSGDESTEEYGVAIAASLAKRYLELNVKVGLLSNSIPPVVLPAQTGDRHLSHLMEALAAVKAQGSTPLVDFLAAHEGKLKQNATLLVITSSHYDGLATALRRLFQRNIRSLVLQLDPTSFGGPLEVLRLAETLAANGIPSYLIRKRESVALALAAAMPWMGERQTSEAPLTSSGQALQV
jgi:uncharacterized protein (DUF58 family)